MAKYLFKQSDFSDPEKFHSLQKFTENELDSFMELLSKGLNVATIRERFSGLPEGRIDDSIPYVLSDDRYCDMCDSLIYLKYQRVNKKLHLIDEFCFNCHHQSNGNCSCQKCLEYYSKIMEVFYCEHYPNSFDINELSVFDEAKLQFLICSFYDEETNTIKLNNRYQNLNRNRQIPIEYQTIFNYLFNRKLIKPSAYHNNHLIEILPKAERDDYTKGYLNFINLTDVFWDLNITAEKEKLEVKDFSGYIIRKNHSDKEKSLLWRDLYKDEITKYTYYNTDNILNMEFNPFLFEFMTDLLIEKYSISQAYSLIYYALKSSLWYATKYKPDRAKITSNFRNNLIRNVESFEVRTTKNFNRPGHLYVSDYNMIVLIYFLNVEGEYLYLNTKDIIPEYQGIENDVTTNEQS